MGWYSSNELNDMRRRDLESQIRDLEREYDYAYSKLRNPGEYEDVNLLERTCSRISEKISSINSELNSL